MRASRRVLATTLLATVALAGCTSGGEPEEDTAPTTEALEGSVPDSGWWCRMFDEEIVAAATGDRTAEAREVLRQNDEEGWQCEVVLPVDGGPETESVLTLTIEVDPGESMEQWRSEAQAAGAEPGPDYLGESYVYPGTVVSIVPCGGPAGTPLAGTRVPFVVSVVGHSAAAQEMTEELVDPARRTVVDLDQTSGCSPRLADQLDDEPADDASETTGTQG